MPIPFNPRSLPSLQCWIAADRQAGLAEGDPIVTAVDASSFGRHGDGTGHAPTYRKGACNGLPAYEFNGTTSYLSLPNFLGSFTSGEAFIIVKIDQDPPPTLLKTGLWNLNGGTADTHFPYTDGVIYDGFGATVRKTTINPAPSLASWRMYNVSSRAGEWISRLDGVPLFTTATNTVGWTATPRLGLGVASSVYLAGRIAEFLLFAPALVPAVRRRVERYLAAKYRLYPVATDGLSLDLLAAAALAPAPAGPAANAVPLLVF